jgi:hypothetical protein
VDRRAALGLAVAMYTVQILASAALVALTPHSSSGGLAEFRLYFTVGDWLAVRIPLATAVGAIVLSVWLTYRNSDPSVSGPHGTLQWGAALLRVISVGAGVACGSLTVGLVSWMVALRIEATQRFFPHLLDWSGASIGYAIVTAVTIGLVSVVFAFEPDDVPRAAYFALCFGLLFLFAAMSVLAYDLVGATYIWPAMAALAASALTLVTAMERLRTLLAILLAILGVAVLWVTVFNARWAGATAIALILLQALSIRWLTMPQESASVRRQ